MNPPHAMLLMNTEKPMTQSPAKLLLIGEDVSARAAKSSLLRQMAFDVDEAPSAQEAAERLAAETYGSILVMRPALDDETRDICQNLKKVCSAISILLIADTDGSADKGVGIDTFIDGILFEPVAPLELVTWIRTLSRLNRPELSASGVSTASMPHNKMAPEGIPDAEWLEAQLGSLYTSSIDAIASIDANDAISSWNEAAERLFGYSAAEVIGKRVQEFTNSPDLIADRHQYLQHLHDGEPIEYQAVRQRKTGEPIEIWVRGAPIKTPDGRGVGASFFVRDITAQKQREQHVHFLMRELTHRSKNLLAVIQAMARQSLSHLSSPQEFVTRFSERLSGLAGSHDLLSNVDWEGASLIDLIRSQLRHYEDHFDERFHLDGPDLFLRPEAAQNIGIALHELSTNAAKYGALSVPGGHVSISWNLKTEKDTPRLRMIWQEKGGPPVDPPGHKGFGHVVMDRITGQALGGTSRAQFHPEGVNWQLDVPAASIVLEREKL